MVGNNVSDVPDVKPPYVIAAPHRNTLSTSTTIIETDIAQ